MSRSLFLTGAGGFVGRHLLPRLRERGIEVTCLVRRPPGPDGVRSVVGDLTQPGPWEEALQEVDTVLHAAAATGAASREVHARVNGDGTAALVQRAAARGAGRFVFVSTVAVKFADTRRYPYARAKQRAEQAVREGGIPWVIVRPTMVFGPGAPVLVGLRRLARLPVVPLFGGGRARVQPVDVSDLAELLAAVVDDASLSREVLEAGGPDVVPLADLLSVLRRLEGKPPRAVRLPAGPVASFLWTLERAGLRLPVTAGQIATFVEDGVAEGTPWVPAQRILRTPLREMLRAVA
ncbi:MAG TPA: NAD-dependent epimerase/dehydratase family protein [Candidatus Polarisedimenticolaceae bacterium]|nr:NAD-dependent epimerase/dehydratase family protein [Candidatus Polarisedimenticolaceae bacterium]